MKIPFLTFVLFSLLGPAAYSANDFPVGPDSKLTPGSLCDSNSQIRYPEHIRYCNRDVDSSLKKEIIDIYDSVLGYDVGQMNRADFKIDHYIPLCMGGSNDVTNLWPQHKSVFGVTDPLEATSCLKMAAGRLLQTEAISIIKRAKANLTEAVKLIQYVEKL